jgi:hypothetical protein
VLAALQAFVLAALSGFQGDGSSCEERVKTLALCGQSGKVDNASQAITAIANVMRYFPPWSK